VGKNVLPKEKCIVKKFKIEWSHWCIVPKDDSIYYFEKKQSVLNIFKIIRDFLASNTLNKFSAWKIRVHSISTF
jgi:hypothetical protein